MDYSFPYSIAVLTTGNGVPSNGTPVHARDFNRLFSEVTALEAAIGKGIAGNKADLKTRLAIDMNDDGTYKKELLCEDDPSGNKRGTARFLHGNISTGTIELNKVLNVYVDLFFKLPYCLYPSPPVVISWLGSTVAGHQVGLERPQIRAISEVGVLLEVRDHAGGAAGALSYNVHFFALSLDLEVFEDNVPWAIPPVRTGS